jgi:hypothetical protein
MMPDLKLLHVAPPKGKELREQISPTSLTMEVLLNTDLSQLPLNVSVENSTTSFEIHLLTD